MIDNYKEKTLNQLLNEAGVRIVQPDPEAPRRPIDGNGQLLFDDGLYEAWGWLRENGHIPPDGGLFASYQEAPR